MEMKALGSRGQAAVTDAIYFLMVVTFLSIFMFGFANTYGNSIREKISNEYSTTFSTNALKAILYASTPRDPSMTVYDKGAEIDYLLAMVKESYSDQATLGPAQQAVLAKTILAVMKPVGDTKDYVFTLSIRPQEQTNRLGSFVFIFFHTTNFSTDTTSRAAGLPLSYTIQRPGKPPHRDYICTPKSDDYSKISTWLSRVFSNVGSTSESSAQIKLVQENRADRTWSDFRAQADLVMWDALWLGETRDRKLGLFYGTQNQLSEIPAEWACTEYAPQATVPQTT